MSHKGERTGIVGVPVIKTAPSDSKQIAHYLFQWAVKVLQAYKNNTCHNVALSRQMGEETRAAKSGFTGNFWSYI